MPDCSKTFRHFYEKATLMTKLKNLFGLLGRNIGYSFSVGYFSKKFNDLNLNDYEYKNFDISTIEEFQNCLSQNPNLKGMNVTIPYKEAVIPYLHKISKKAQKIGAVNTIKISKKGKTKGYNTDYYGFKKSLEPLLESHHKKALLLGTGGASKGVAFALDQLGITYTFVSRISDEQSISYNLVNATSFDNHQIIINCTPLGTSPNLDLFPEIPYEYFTSKHIAYDLIYNPNETIFLQKAKKKGAVIKNGLDMLHYQAEKSWKIWKK